jgi:hypothetical protein
VCAGYAEHAAYVDNQRAAAVEAAALAAAIDLEAELTAYQAQQAAAAHEAALQAHDPPAGLAQGPGAGAAEFPGLGGWADQMVHADEGNQARHAAGGAGWTPWQAPLFWK